MEVDSLRIFAILSMSYITTRIVKTQTSVTKIPRVPVENEITTPSVVKIAIKFSPYGKLPARLFFLFFFSFCFSSCSCSCQYSLCSSFLYISLEIYSFWLSDVSFFEVIYKTRNRRSRETTAGLHEPSMCEATPTRYSRSIHVTTSHPGLCRHGRRAVRSGGGCGGRERERERERELVVVANHASMNPEPPAQVQGQQWNTKGGARWPTG